eukprot:g1098.t1
MPTAQQDIAALQAIHEALNGPHWTPAAQVNWTEPGLDPCDHGWAGIQRQNALPGFGQRNVDLEPCTGKKGDSDRRVQSLSLPAVNISGVLPTEIGALDKLVYLLIYPGQPETVPYSGPGIKNGAVWANGLSGTIPESLSEMTSLRYLFLFGCRSTDSPPKYCP